MCGLLLNKLNYVAYSVRGVVAYQKMYMVFIGFHSYNAVTFGFKYLLAILSDEDNMYFQAIFTPVAMVISAIHRIRTLILCEVTTFCVKC